MKQILSALLMILFSAGSFAQFTLDWMQSAGNYSKTSVMSAVDHSSNILVTGYWQNYQIYTRKYDLAGNLLWERSDSSGVPGLYEKPNWINCDADNNVFVVGNRYSFSTSTGWDYPEAIVALKYDSSGTLMWKQTIPVTVLITPTIRFNLRSEVDADGNLYIGTIAAVPQGVVLYKLDPAGNLVFANNTSLNAPVNFASMRLRDDRVFLVTGSGSGLLAPVFVFDTAGVLQWTAAPQGKGAFDVETGEDGSVYVLSYWQNSVSSSSGADFIIVKFDSAGTQLWSHDFDFGGGEVPTRFVCSNGRISVTGWGPASPSAAYFDWKTFQVDTAGNLLWFATYDATSFNDEVPYGLVATEGGSVIVTGKGGPSPDPINPSYIQMPIVQYSNTGNQIWTDTPNMYGGWGLACSFAGDSSLYVISSADMTVYHYKPLTVSVEPGNQDFQNVTIGPNPCSGIFSVSLPHSTEIAEVFLYDMSGKLIAFAESAEGKAVMDLSAFSDGLYFCKIISGTFVKTLKLVKSAG